MSLMLKEKKDSAYISNGVETNVCKMTIHAFHKNLVIHEIWRATNRKKKTKKEKIRGELN